MKIICNSLPLMVLLLLAGAASAISVESYKMTFALGEAAADVLLEIDTGSANLTSMKFNTDEVSRFRAYDSRGPLEYKTNETDKGIFTEVFLRGDRKLFLEFSSEKFIFTSGDIKQFFLDLSLEFEVKSVQVVVKLPVSYITDSHFPRGAQITSDGSRIILDWSFESPRSLLASARFRKAEQLSFLPLIAGIVVAMLAVFAVFYYRKRSFGEFLSGFSEDEAKVIEYLKRERNAYQNKIEKHFAFSRPKMTRIVQKLEAKGLLEKHKKGRTNRLTWAKGKAAKGRAAAARAATEITGKETERKYEGKEKEEKTHEKRKEKKGARETKKEEKPEKEVYFWDKETGEPEAG